MAQWLWWLRRDVEEKRLVAHVCRELRRQQAKIDRGKARGSPSITMKELKEKFKSMTSAVIQSRLRERCDCQPDRVSVNVSYCSH